MRSFLVAIFVIQAALVCVALVDENQQPAGNNVENHAMQSAAFWGVKLRPTNRNRAPVESKNDQQVPVLKKAVMSKPAERAHIAASVQPKPTAPVKKAAPAEPPKPVEVAAPVKPVEPVKPIEPTKPVVKPAEVPQVVEEQVPEVQAEPAIEPPAVHENEDDEDEDEEPINSHETQETAKDDESDDDDDDFGYLLKFSKEEQEEEKEDEDNYWPLRMAN